MSGAPARKGPPSLLELAGRVLRGEITEEEAIAIVRRTRLDDSDREGVNGS